MINIVKIIRALFLGVAIYCAVLMDSSNNEAFSLESLLHEENPVRISFQKLEKFQKKQILKTLRENLMADEVSLFAEVVRIRHKRLKESEMFADKWYKLSCELHIKPDLNFLLNLSTMSSLEKKFKGHDRKKIMEKTHEIEAKNQELRAKHRAKLEKAHEKFDQIAFEAKDIYDCICRHITTENVVSFSFLALKSVWTIFDGAAENWVTRHLHLILKQFEA
jgi:hypothetical protein